MDKSQEMTKRVRFKTSDLVLGLLYILHKFPGEGPLDYALKHMTLDRYEILLWGIGEMDHVPDKEDEDTSDEQQQAVVDFPVEVGQSGNLQVSEDMLSLARKARESAKANASKREHFEGLRRA